MDRLTPEERSRLMARVRSKDSSAEIRVRRATHGLGLRYRLHRRGLPGTPDLVFAKCRVVIFVHGCFWHRHPGCKKATTPKSREEFWRSKFEGNVARDRRVSEKLGEMGWRVAVIWECECNRERDLHCRLREIFGLADG